MHYLFFLISLTLFFFFETCGRTFFLTAALIALAVWASASFLKCKADPQSQGRISRSNMWLWVECAALLLVTLTVWQWGAISYFYHKHSTAFVFSDEDEKNVARLPIFPFKANQPIDSIRYKQVDDSLENAATDEFLGRIKVGATVFTAVSSIESMFAGNGPIPLGCGRITNIEGMYASQFPRPLFGIYVTIDPGCATDTLPADVRRQRFRAIESLLASHYGQPHYVAGDTTLLSAWKFHSRLVAVTYVGQRNEFEGDRFAIIQCSADGYNELCALAAHSGQGTQASGDNGTLQPQEKARKKHQAAKGDSGEFVQRHL